MAEVEIVVREGQGWITGTPTDAAEQIKRATSYRPAGFQFSPKFNRFIYKGGERRRMWDGWVRLFKHSKFPAGLLSRVTQVLDTFEVEYSVDIELAQERPDITITTTGIEDRWYQDEAVEAALLTNRGVVRAPTGSGKTPIGARIIAARGKWSVVVVPTIDLLYQYKEFLEEHLVGVEIGQLGDGVVNPKEVTVATVRTMANAMNVAYKTYEYGEYDDKDDTKVDPTKLRTWLAKIGLLIVDEAHILGADVVFQVATKLAAPAQFGMSASPWRDDGADLKIEAATGPIIYRIGTDALVADGYLVPPVISVVNTRSWWQPAAWEKNQFAQCYKEEIVENEVRNSRITEIVNDLGVPNLVLVKQINHGRRLAENINDCVFLSGKDSGHVRREVFDDMRAGRVRSIVATTIADMGLDLPICSALTLAGGGKSSTRHLQRIGRVARPYPGKKSAFIVDFDDGHVNDWFANHEQERRKIERAEWGESALWI